VISTDWKAINAKNGSNCNIAFIVDESGWMATMKKRLDAPFPQTDVRRNCETKG